jgi:hypothetical protein
MTTANLRRYKRSTTYAKARRRRIVDFCLRVCALIAASAWAGSIWFMLTH